MTRGEPRPVHITLIATSSHLSAGVYVLKFQAVIPRITPGPPRGVKALRRFNSTFFHDSLAGPGRCLSCTSAGPEAQGEACCARSI